MFGDVRKIGEGNVACDHITFLRDKKLCTESGDDGIDGS